jgi:hypothetical protein
MSPSDRVAQLYQQALSSLFVAFYDSQGYGGGILARLHTGKQSLFIVRTIKKYIMRTECRVFKG